MVNNPTCDACGKPATHVDAGFVGQQTKPEVGWSCPEHAISIDLKPIEEVFDNDRR